MLVRITKLKGCVLEKQDYLELETKLIMNQTMRLFEACASGMGNQTGGLLT